MRRLPIHFVRQRFMAASEDQVARATIPAAEAFRPLKEGGCPLVNG